MTVKYYFSWKIILNEDNFGYDMYYVCVCNWRAIGSNSLYSVSIIQWNKSKIVILLYVIYVILFISHIVTSSLLLREVETEWSLDKLYLLK